MGSESPRSIRFNLTGFKKFHGVTDNPTEILVGKIEEHMRKHEMPSGAILGSCSVLETAGEGALDSLILLLNSESEQTIIGKAGGLPGVQLLQAPTDQVVWVHFGVNSGATNFAVERRAVNEATFRCPDELGWQPQRVPIVVEDGSISHIRETILPVHEIVSGLSKEGYDVVESYDAGRFVCNYVYYHSLRHAQINGVKSLFVHVPLFSVIDQERQLQFIASLLKALTVYC